MFYLFGKNGFWNISIIFKNPVNYRLLLICRAVQWIVDERKSWGSLFLKNSEIKHSKIFQKIPFSSLIAALIDEK